MIDDRLLPPLFLPPAWCVAAAAAFIEKVGNFNKRAFFCGEEKRTINHVDDIVEKASHIELFLI